MKKHKYCIGDLVISNLAKVFPEDKSWYGFILAVHPSAPKTFPILREQNIKYNGCGGTSHLGIFPPLYRFSFSITYHR